MAAVAGLLAEGVDVVLTHGNGPQVGNLLVKNELAAAVVPPVPLDWCGAQTQATLGFVLMNALDAALARRGVDRRTATVVTRTLRRRRRPRLHHADQADRPLPARRGGGAARRPRRDLGGPRREGLAPRGRLARAARDPRRPGRAGAGRRRLRGGRQRWRRDPRRTPRRRLARGVEAVIDKDLGAALLARTVAADVLVIATDVPNAVLRFGTPEAEPIGRVTVAELRALRRRGPLRQRLDGPEGGRRLPVRRARRHPRRHHQPRPHRRRGRPGDAGTVVVPTDPSKGTPCPAPSKSARSRSTPSPTPPSSRSSSTTG